MIKKLSFLTSNREFYPTLLKVSLPIILQGFVTTSLNFIDVLMIGQLGSQSIASVGLGNQFTFIYIMLVNGIGSGAAIFTAQYWGRRYVKNIRQTFGIGLRYALIASIVFCTATFFFSEYILSFYTKDTQVQILGGHYLQLVGMSYVFFAISAIYAAVLRSTKHVLLPLISSIIALSINTILNYTLILGHFGAPALGVTGAGISMLVARIVECGIIIGVTKYRKIPTIINVRKILWGKIHNQRRYLNIALPVIIHSMGWILGISMYMRIYASISTTSIAAINISETIEKMGLMILVGISNACAIMVGNSIGAGRDDLAIDYSRKFIFISISGALIIGLFVMAIRNHIIGLYNLDAEGVHAVSNLLFFMSCVMWMKAANVVFNGGIFRSGGDTRFSMMLDIGGVWLIGVPMGCLAAYYFHFPVYYVALMIYSEELVKMTLGFIRLRSNKWLRNLVKHN